MTMVRGLGLAVVACLCAAPVLADVYECEFPEHEANQNWLPTVVVVEHDSKSNEVTVYDPLIKHYKGAPIPGKVETNNEVRISYTWRLNGMKDIGGQMVNQTYRLTIRKAGLSAKVSGKALGYANSVEEAAGSCKKHKG